MKRLILSMGIVCFLLSNAAAQYTIELVKDIYPDGQPKIHDFKVFNGKLFFSADDGVHDPEVWVSDGTESGTRLFKDIYNYSHPEGSDPREFTVFKNQLFFTAYDTTGFELWVSDGTEEAPDVLKISTLRNQVPQTDLQNITANCIFLPTAIPAGSNCG